MKEFSSLHGIGKARFRNLVKHYKSNGVSARMHGNCKHKPWNAARFEDKERAVTFITKVHALPLPGRMPHFKDYNIMLLPSETTKASVYREYTNTSGEFVRYFGYCEFCRLWKEVVPYIRTIPPAEDICHVCQENAVRIMQSANYTEKKELLVTAEKHLGCAKKKRVYYQKQVDESKDSVKSGTLATRTYI